MGLTPEQLDELVGGCKAPKDVESLYSQMLQHMINRSLEAEIRAHLGYERHESAEDRAGSNRRNGKSGKQVLTVGKLHIETLRARADTVESALADLYGVEISHTLIAQVTDAVLDEVRTWQARPPRRSIPSCGSTGSW